MLLDGTAVLDPPAIIAESKGILVGSDRTHRIKISHGPEWVWLEISAPPSAVPLSGISPIEATAGVGSLRGEFVPVPYPRSVLFTEELEFQLDRIPRLKPHVFLRQRTLDE
jgi:hypothetical protein